MLKRCPLPISAKELAANLGISYKTVLRRIARGQYKPLPGGREHLFCYAEAKRITGEAEAIELSEIMEAAKAGEDVILSPGLYLISVQARECLNQ